MSSSWKVGGSHRGEIQSPGNPREQVKMKSRAPKRHQEAPAPSSLMDCVTVSKSLGLTEWPCFPRRSASPHSVGNSKHHKNALETVKLSMNGRVCCSRVRGPALCPAAAPGTELLEDKDPIYPYFSSVHSGAQQWQGNNTNTFIMRLLGVSPLGWWWGGLSPMWLEGSLVLRSALYRTGNTAVPPRRTPRLR